MTDHAAPPDVGAVSREPLDPMGDAASSEAAGKPATSMMAPWPESTTPNAASADLNEPADKDAGPPAISPSPLDSPPAAAASQNTAISTPAAEPTVNPSQDISTVSGPHRVEIEAQGGVQVGRPRPFLWQPPLDAEDGPSTSSAPSTVFSRPERDDSFAEARNACDSILFCMDDADPSYSNIEVKPVEGQGGPNFYNVSALTRNGSRVDASRRFNDLVVLHENLKTTFRGCVVPFRPGKTFANSTALRNHRDSFLRDRAYAIKCYLIKITRHPDIKDSTAVKQFMESSEVLGHSAMWAAEQPHRTSYMGGFVRSVKKLVGSEPRIPTPSQVEAGGGKSEHDLVQQMAEMRINRMSLKDAADNEEQMLFEMGDMLLDMLKANQALASAASSMMDAAHNLIDVHTDNGAGLQAMYKFETSFEGPPNLHLSQTALKTMAACIDAFAGVISHSKDLTLTRQMAILEAINDHAYSLPRVEKALAARLNALVVLESLKRQEGIINASYNQLLAKERSGAMSNADVRRMNRVRAETDQIKQAKEAGERVFGLLKSRNTRDIDWYRKGRSAQFRVMVARFAQAQAAHQAALAELWLAMAVRSGYNLEGFGSDLDGVMLPMLGKPASRSAALLETDGPSAAVAGVDEPLPAEFAGTIDD